MLSQAERVILDNFAAIQAPLKRAGGHRPGVTEMLDRECPRMEIAQHLHAREKAVAMGCHARCVSWFANSSRPPSTCRAALARRPENALAAPYSCNSRARCSSHTRASEAIAAEPHGRIARR
jgi:hypothetical protein